MKEWKSSLCCYSIRKFIKIYQYLLYYCREPQAEETSLEHFLSIRFQRFLDFLYYYDNDFLRALRHSFVAV